MHSYVSMLIRSLAPTMISAYDTLARSSREGALRSTILRLSFGPTSLDSSCSVDMHLLFYELHFSFQGVFVRSSVKAPVITVYAMLNER
jgi:hypothetical protein